MNVEEIVKTLRKNKMLSSVIPTWAYATIPYPFVRNGLKCLGFYFYQLKKDGGNRRIMAPIFQIVVTYPSAKIVSITTSPLFLLHGMNPDSELGFYPSKGLAGKSLQDADAAYAAYYTACDNYFLSGAKEDWLRNLQVVKEDGMEPYYALFTMKPVDEPVRPVIAERTVECPARSGGNMSKFSPCALRIARKAREFLSDKTFGRQLKELAILSRNFERADYRVAVIGEFSRGKSTFLNGLIGRELLPIGDLPTTAVLTQIRKSSPEGLAFIGKDKSVSQGKLSAENLEKYLADDAGRDPEGVLDLQVELPWLPTDNVVFYDTPGTGDLVGKRASIVLNAINSCDFTIMAISARAACSMTEMQFLRDNVILKKIPQIAVAITKLDAIPEGERNKVVSFVRERIAAVAPSVRYFLMNDLAGVDRSQFDAIGVGEIRESIVSTFSSEKEVALARERQYLQRILLLLEEARKEIDVIAAAEKMTEQEKKDAIRKLEMAKADIDIVRLNLATKCSEAKLEAQNQIVDVVNEAESALMKKITYSIQHSNDIRQWLELDFPHISDEYFRATGMKLDAWMGRRLANDKSAFAEAVRKQLAVQNLNISLPSFSVLPSDFRVDADMKNLDKWRTGARLATVGAMVLLSGLGPGVIIASGIGGILTDRFLKANIEKQRADALAAISSKVQSVHSDLKDRAVDYLEGCYGKLAKVLNDETQYAVDNAIAKIKTAESLADKMARPSVEKTKKLNALLSEVDACVRPKNS